MKKSMFIMLMVMGVTACLGPMAPIRDAQDSQVGFVYGYLNGRAGVPNLRLYSFAADPQAPARPGTVPAHTYENGLIVFDNVAPGRYSIISFGVGRNTYVLGQQAISVTVRPGEVKYLGSYQYSNEPGLFNKSFSFGLVDKPSQRQVLLWAVDAANGTSWKARLQKQLADLK